MFCSNCGNQIEDNAKFCNKCGFKINTLNEVEQENLTNENIKFKCTKEIGPLEVDSEHKLFKAKGRKEAFKKESKHSLLKGIMAVSTAGMSVIAEKAVKGINNGTIKDVYNFSDLNSFELMEDDSQVTSGGVGQALVGGLLFDGAGLIAGGITGKRKTKKVVESMFIKLHINDFNNPLIMIPLITEKTKVNSKEYKEAFNLANQLIAMLDLITHNK